MSVAIPEYMRVRKYLYGLIYHCDGKDLRIPPENELARMFGVSRVTVRGAISGLVKDRYLISRRGVGTFINPDAVSKDFQIYSIIGILRYDGRQVYNSCSSSIIRAVERFGMFSEILNLPDSDSPERLPEIVRNNVSGIIWDNPAEAQRPYLSALKSAGIPLLIYGNRINDGFDTVRDGDQERGVLLADYLWQNGHHKMLYIHNTPSGDGSLAADFTLASFSQRMRELSGEPFDGYINLATFQKWIDSGKISQYSVIYSSARITRFVTEMLEKAGLRIPEDISYLSAWETSSLFFHGKKPCFIDIEQDEVSCILQWLKTKVSGDSTENFFRIPQSFIMGGDTVKSRR